MHTEQFSLSLVAAMATEVAAPTAEDKARYDAAKEEVVKALAKKREADKRLVRSIFSLLLKVIHVDNRLS